MRALESARAQTGVDVTTILVGNGWDPVGFPDDVRTVHLPENVGPAEGHNIGVAHGTSSATEPAGPTSVQTAVTPGSWDQVHRTAGSPVGVACVVVGTAAGGAGRSSTKGADVPAALGPRAGVVTTTLSV